MVTYRGDDGRCIAYNWVSQGARTGEGSHSFFFDSVYLMGVYKIIIVPFLGLALAVPGGFSCLRQVDSLTLCESLRTARLCSRGSWAITCRPAPIRPVRPVQPVKIPPKHPKSKIDRTLAWSVR